MIMIENIMSYELFTGLQKDLMNSRKRPGMMDFGGCS